MGAADKYCWMEVLWTNIQCLYTACGCVNGRLQNTQQVATGGVCACATGWWDQSHSDLCLFLHVQWTQCCIVNAQFSNSPVHTVAARVVSLSFPGVLTMLRGTIWTLQTLQIKISQYLCPPQYHKHLWLRQLVSNLSRICHLDVLFSTGIFWGLEKCEDIVKLETRTLWPSRRKDVTHLRRSRILGCRWTNCAGTQSPTPTNQSFKGEKYFNPH